MGSISVEIEKRSAMFSAYTIVKMASTYQRSRDPAVLVALSVIEDPPRTIPARRGDIDAAMLHHASKRHGAPRAHAGGLEAVARGHPEQARHIGEITHAGAAAALVIDRQPRLFIPDVVDEAGHL